MKYFLGVALLFCVIFVSGTQAAVEYGNCVLTGTDNAPDITGWVTFFVENNNVTMHVVANDIPGGDQMHGVHIHQYGDLSATDAVSAGGHYNPQGVDHACPENGTDRHNGDAGNWDKVNGSINMTKSLDLLALTGGESIIGRAVILHETTDDCAQPTTGNAGVRWAYCVIGVGNPTTLTPADEVNNAVQGVTGITKAVSVLTSASNAASGADVTGIVLFEQVGGMGPVTVSAIIVGLTNQTVHGFHLHQWGDLTSASGAAAGSHFNPTNSRHGIPGADYGHLGDMGNINFFDETGEAFYSFENDRISLNGVNSIIGRAVIVHELQDDCSDPVGNAGVRLAQGVIGIANPTTTITLAADVPTVQDSSACPALTEPTETGDSTKGSVASSVGVAIPMLLFALVAVCLL